MDGLNAGIRRLAVVASCVALSAFASSVLAADEGEQQWLFEITPYLFAAGLNGTVGVRGVTADVDVPFHKLVEYIDAGFMGAFEARKENWLFALDAIYVHLKDEGTKSWQGPGGIGSATGSLEATVTMQVYQPFVGYRVVDDKVKLDVIGGARYTQLNAELDLTVTTGGLLPGGGRSVDGHQSWWDPIVGARITVPVAEHSSLVGYADVGGGIGGGSDSTYQMIAGANWDFAKNFSAKAGYRYLHQDYQNGGFVWNLALEGAFLGLGIKF